LLSDDQPSAFEILARRNGYPSAVSSLKVIEVRQKRSSTRVIAMALLIFVVLIEVYFAL